MKTVWNKNEDLMPTLFAVISFFFILGYSIIVYGYDFVVFSITSRLQNHLPIKVIYLLMIIVVSTPIISRVL